MMTASPDLSPPNEHEPLRFTSNGSPSLSQEDFRTPSPQDEEDSLGNNAPIPVRDGQPAIASGNHGGPPPHEGESAATMPSTPFTPVWNGLEPSEGFLTPPQDRTPMDYLPVQLPQRDGQPAIASGNHGGSLEFSPPQGFESQRDSSHLSSPREGEPAAIMPSTPSTPPRNRMEPLEGFLTPPQDELALQNAAM